MRQLRKAVLGDRTSAGSLSALFGGPGLAEQDDLVMTSDDPGQRAEVPWSNGPYQRSYPHCRAGERVFDTAADSRNEPSFNPAMTGVELLTPLPIGLGTRFRARMGKAGGEMLVELTEFERPHRLSSRTASSMMQTTGRLTFAAEGDGTVMSWDWQVRPRGWMRILGPLAGALGGRMERRIWTGLKHQLEDPGSARSP